MSAFEAEIPEPMVGHDPAVLEEALGDVPAPEDVPAFDRDALIAQIVERLEIDEDADIPDHLVDKPVGKRFERMLLADLYATMYEFRLWADAYQRSGFGKLLTGGGRRRRGRKGGSDGQG